MAELWKDGFDHYNAADLLKKWDSSGGTFSMATGITGLGQALQFPTGTSNVVKNLSGNVSTIFCGGRLSTPAATVLFTLQDAGSAQIVFTLNALGGIAVTVGATTIGTSANSVVPFGAGFYLEVEVIFATGATGTCIVRVNGTAVLTVTGVKTANTANAFCNQINWNKNNTGQAMLLDDVYVNDSTGSHNNGFQGDVAVRTLAMNGAGRLTQWTKSGGSTNWGQVSETLADGDTSYNSSATVGQIDAYTLAALSAASVLSVTITAEMRKDDASTRSVALGWGDGTAEDFDAGHALSTSYLFFTRTMDINPRTSSAWATADFTTGQAAIKVIA